MARPGHGLTDRSGSGLLPTVLILLLACDPEAPEPKAEQIPPVPEVVSPEPTLRRLTTAQYENSVTDLLGEGLVMPTSLEPDTEIDGLFSVGAAETSVSPTGVVRYEDAAYLLAGQALSEERRAAVMPCTPSDIVDAECAGQFVAQVGRRAWRRALAEEEQGRLVQIAGDAAAVVGDFHGGLTYALAAILQSPNFLYRVELGVPDPELSGRRVLTGYELATRLSYFYWNTTPDEALLAAAEAGELDSAEGLEAAAARLLADQRSRAGVRNFFTEMLGLYALDTLSKDPLVFLHMSPEVGPSAREETLLTIEDTVFTQDGDYRDLFTTRKTFLDRKLAAIYNVRAPVPDGFGATELPEDGGRRGLLGQASFLALNAHAVSSSATLRGKFVREVLMCQPMPLPPANANTAIPEATEDMPTLRDRVQVHLTDPSCASCHRPMDLIGLGFENFDGLGGWRATENGATIDPSGELDGAAFKDAWGMAALVREAPELTACLTQTMYRYAVGHSIAAGEEELTAWLDGDFARAGYSIQSLMLAITMSPGFRYVGEVQP